MQKWNPSLKEKMNFRKRTPPICELSRDKEKEDGRVGNRESQGEGKRKKKNQKEIVYRKGERERDRKISEIQLDIEITMRVMHG